MYNANAAVIRSDPTGKAGRDVGSELDLIMNWHISPTTDIVTAYATCSRRLFALRRGRRTTSILLADLQRPVLDP